MGYELQYAKEAIKALARMPRKLSALMVSKISRLADDPASLAAQIRKLKGVEDLYRLRSETTR